MFIALLRNMRQILQAAQGTWHGAAPQGQLRPEQRGSAVKPTEPARPLPHDVRLGSTRMPLLLFHVTAESTSKDVEAVLNAGITGFVCEADAVCTAVLDAAKACGKDAAGLFIAIKVRHVQASSAGMLSMLPMTTLATTSLL